MIELVYNMEKNEINDAFIDRIEQLMSYKSLNQRSFAIEIGFSYSTLNKYCNKKSNTIDFELIYRISSQYSDISTKWLVEGEGPMLLSDNSTNADSSERMLRLVDTIATLQGTINEQMKTIQLLTEDLKRTKGELAMLKNERNIG